MNAGHMQRLLVAALLLSALLSACADRDAATARQEEADDRALPAPTRSSGSVTGMPDKPGPGSVAAVTGQPPAEAPIDYYDSINSRSYARAYSLWSDNGRSSGQSPQQFADGFGDTQQVVVEIQPPGAVDAAAGSRYLEVPVAISATRNDGSVHKYVGAYVLRRAVVDGASTEQRAWRIGSADLREVKP